MDSDAGQVPLWIGFITGFEAAEGGGEAVGEIRRPFWPQATNMGIAAHTTAIATIDRAVRRLRFKLDRLFCIDRF